MNPVRLGRDARQPCLTIASNLEGLVMLVSAGGRERTESEWRALLAEGGFRLCQAHPAGPTSAVIEASPS